MVLTLGHQDVITGQLENVHTNRDLSSFLPPVNREQLQKMFEQSIILAVNDLTNFSIQMDELGQDIPERYELDQNRKKFWRQLRTTRFDIHSYIYY